MVTSGHFRIGGPLTTVPEPTLPVLGSAQPAYWQLIQQWAVHYLQRGQSILKWHHPSNQLRVGSLVLRTGLQYPPCKWTVAQMPQLHPGKSRLAQVATLKTAVTKLTRPIAKLDPLPALNPLDGSTDDDEDHHRRRR